MAKRARLLLRSALPALFLVVVFGALAWDQGGGDGKHLWADLVVGCGATALVYASWWLARRYLRATKRAFYEAYADALAQRRPRARPLARDVAGRAGRFVGSLRRAYREGYGDDGRHPR